MVSILEIKNSLQDEEHTAAIKYAIVTDTTNVVRAEFGRKAAPAFQAAA